MARNKSLAAARVPVMPTVAPAWETAGRERHSRIQSSLVPKCLILGILAGLALFMGLSWEDYLDELESFLYGEEGSWLLTLGQVSLWIALAALLWNIILAAMYRPATPATDAELPMVTVVVPAYNEGAQVLGSLESLCAGDYPRDKLQIVAVDDGSKDDTWLWMRRAARRHPGRLELVRLAANSGKRHALYAGFQRARGEILVTVDSDSEVAPDGLRHLVTPMVRDAKVGTVAGNVRVLNLNSGSIPRMLEVAFTFSFDFIRAGQSSINTVLTTPGAFSAYRRSVLEGHLEKWVDQCFLGRPANIGEDRALTNLVLRQGFHAHFAREALVRTEVPTGYNGLCRMFLRWARSNVRETLVMCGFAFRRFREGGALGARLTLLLQVYRMTVGEVLKLATVAFLIMNPVAVGYNLLLAVLAGALIPALVYIWRHHGTNFLWSFPYALVYLVGLSWISLWALVTPHRSGWLTRGLGGCGPALQEHPAEVR